MTSNKVVKYIEEQVQDSENTRPIRAATATFLFKVMPVDGQTHPMELDRLVRILCDDFSLETAEAEELIAHAKQQDTSEESLGELAEILKANVERPELLTLISHLWEMVFADGVLHETEIVFIERVARLLDIPQDDVSKAMNS